MTRTAIRRIDKLENRPEARGGELIPASHKAFKSMTISFPETSRQLNRGDLAKDRADAVGNVRHNGSRGDCHVACHQGVLDLALHLLQVNHFCLKPGCSECKLFLDRAAAISADKGSERKPKWPIEMRLKLGRAHIKTID